MRLSILCTLIFASFASAASVDYEREVKPIFREHCSACHGALKQNGGLRVDTGDFLRGGGVSGAAIIPGRPHESLLLKVVSGRGDFQMPPEGEGSKLSAAKLDILTRWIAEGAITPNNERPDEDPKRYWSYQPVRRPEVPLIAGTTANSPIDFLIAAKHLEHGLTERPQADKATLLRRVTLDLIGLPPTREELHEFLADPSPDAYERLTDRLLAHPAYGQRWGRHWMDVWRYSDWYGSRGINEIRYGQRHLWRWRDWIIESLNAGHGYDRMVQEMLAGDEIAPGDPDVIRATGFLGRNWYKFDRNVWMFETIEQTSQAFLATTMKCARCHDHKFDPLVQQDYYRFRAYFEPHDVRTVPLSGDLSTEKDATLGPVLKTGVSQVYDKQLDARTYVFQRGDDRYPDQNQLMAPGVPDVFGVKPVPITPIDLPIATWYPSLRPPVIAGLERDAANLLAQAETDLSAKQQIVTKLKQKLNDLVLYGNPAAEPTFGTTFTEYFEQLRPEVWKVASGEWEHVAGKLLQKVPGSFVTITADVSSPRDFMARVKYRPLEAGDIHSVGFFFDLVGLKDAQAIYSATNSTSSSIQAFHRKNGVESYPAAGVVPWPIKIGQEVTVEMATRGQQLNVWVNGELAIAYVMPQTRQNGKFGLWTHSGSAEFLEVLIDPLPSDFRLASTAAEKIRSPFQGVSRADLEFDIARAVADLPFAEKDLAIARAEQEWLAWRIVAEREKADRLMTHIPSGLAVANKPSDPPPTAIAAAQAERQATLLRAERDVQIAERTHAEVNSAVYASDEAKNQAVMQSEAKVSAAKAALDEARDVTAQGMGTYTPLGDDYPMQSSGRRAALAKWITDPAHPRTARVAANHIWLRHFGEAIVPTVANFGLNGQRPSHPELLDWLAAELTASGWEMKRLHRLMITSAAYRRVTTDDPEEKNVSIDPRNIYLWRMNSRRMESEVIRDSTLALSGELDLALNGPEIPETQGETSRRRSLYFRSTPNEKMSFLNVFDQANPNECYRRQESVMPQQALALTNSLLSLDQAAGLCDMILEDLASANRPAQIGNIIPAVFEHVLSRSPKPSEFAACEKFLSKHPTTGDGELPPSAVQSLIHVLINHSDFVTIR